MAHFFYSFVYLKLNWRRELYSMPDLFDQREAANFYELRRKKYHICPNGHEDALLLVNIPENTPNRDDQGRLQYQCLVCNVKFSVDDKGQIVR